MRQSNVLQNLKRNRKMRKFEEAVSSVIMANISKHLTRKRRHLPSNAIPLSVQQTVPKSNHIKLKHLCITGSIQMFCMTHPNENVIRNIYMRKVSCIYANFQEAEFSDIRSNISKHFTWKHKPLIMQQHAVSNASEKLLRTTGSSPSFA